MGFTFKYTVYMSIAHKRTKKNNMHAVLEYTYTVYTRFTKVLKIQMKNPNFHNIKLILFF